MKDVHTDFYEVEVELCSFGSVARMSFTVEATGPSIAEALVRGLYSEETFCRFNTYKLDPAEDV